MPAQTEDWGKGWKGDRGMIAGSATMRRRVLSSDGSSFQDDTRYWRGVPEDWAEVSGVRLEVRQVAGKVLDTLHREGRLTFAGRCGVVLVDVLALGVRLPLIVIWVLCLVKVALHGILRTSS